MQKTLRPRNLAKWSVPGSRSCIFVSFLGGIICGILSPRTCCNATCVKAAEVLLTKSVTPSFFLANVALTGILSLSQVLNLRGPFPNCPCVVFILTGLTLAAGFISVDLDLANNSIRSLQIYGEYRNQAGGYPSSSLSARIHMSQQLETDASLTMKIRLPGP